MPAIHARQQLPFNEAIITQTRNQSLKNHQVQPIQSKKKKTSTH